MTDEQGRLTPCRLLPEPRARPAQAQTSASKPSCDSPLLSCVWLPAPSDPHQLQHQLLMQALQKLAARTDPKLSLTLCMGDSQ